MTAQPNLFDREDAGADFSPCGVYRYRLWRRWDGDQPSVLWVCLNPSTAAAETSTDDATVRRIRGFSKAFGYGGFDLVNLFGFRATNPKELDQATDPVGPGNDDAIFHAAEISDAIILAWGANAKRDPAREEWLCRRLVEAYGAGCLSCLRLTKHGHPEHPLRLPASLRPIQFDPRAA